MNALKRSLLISVCLLLTPPASASGSKSSRDRYASRCQGQTSERGVAPAGTLLWGTKRSWNAEQKTDERRSVLVSIDSEHLLEADDNVKAVRVRTGRLEAWPDASRGLVGTVLRGTSGDGRPVEVAICGAEPAHEDPEMMWYRIEAWNPVAREWENPCLADGAIQDPRAIAVRGVWDASGARQDAPGKLTLACETGAISKCASWGYKPWSQHHGKSLAELHQACTRMARADYCGDGRSHTHEHTGIDMYDALGVLTRVKESTAVWDTARASFEAAWAPDGAACLARTRDGRAMETILQQCPGRFRAGAAQDLGDGDRCTVGRTGESAGPVMLRNRSYGSL